MLARIVAAMTATMLEEKRKKEERRKKKKDAVSGKRKSQTRNTSRGVGRYMGQKALDALKDDF